MAISGFLLLRRDRPGWPRPIRVSAIWVPIAFFLLCVDLIFLIVGLAVVQADGLRQLQGGLIIGIAILAISLVLLHRVVVEDKRKLEWRHAPTSTRTPSPAWRIWTYDERIVRERIYRGGEGRFTMRLALGGTHPQLELIEPLQGPSAYHDWIAQHGYGFHHVGYYVPDARATTAAMERAGFEVLMGGSGFGADGSGGLRVLRHRRGPGLRDRGDRGARPAARAGGPVAPGSRRRTVELLRTASGTS